MINLPSILTANGIAILLLLILLISTRKTNQYEFFDEKIYYMMVFLTILQCVMESGAFFIDGRMENGLRTLNIVLNSFLYINNIMFAFAWTVYADYKLFESKERILKIYPFIAIPAILITIGVIVNLFVPVFFTVSSENVYIRTANYIIPYACTYLYLLYGVVLIYAYRKKVQKYLFMPAIVFMCPILVGSILQFLFYGLSLVWVGVAIALVSLYVTVQNEAANIDKLSGLLTRQYLNNYLTSETKKMNPSKKLFGIMLDIDQFKNINDTYGHLTGDQAIAATGNILRYCALSSGFAARYAGDEFVMIANVKNEEDVQKIIQKIHDETDKFNKTGNQPYELHFSLGYSTFQYEKDTVDSFLSKIDVAMYKDKQQRINAKVLPERRRTNR